MLTFTRHTFIAGLLLGLALVFTGSAPSHAATAPVQHQGYHPCVQEDSPGPCWWDAARQGNGVGQSFWVDRHQAVHYGYLRWRVLGSSHSTLLPDAHRCAHPKGAYADDQWCLTVGPWTRVGQPLADALAEGGSPHADTRAWESCFKDRMPGVGIAIACPDGYIEVA
jgi:hypothetical protein